MREPNLCFPSQSRAAVCITSALYDRRALDCTATLPLVNSLTHLAYLTSTSPRIREILCLDGGLERLVRILVQTSNRSDRLTLWKWTLCFQSIVNVGVRGTENIRTKVVDAGVIPFVLTILGNFTKSFDIINGKREFKKDTLSSTNSNNTNTTQATTTTTTTSKSKGLLDSSSSSSSINSNNNTSIASSSSHPTTTESSQSAKKSILRRSTFPYVKIDPAARRYRRIHKDKESKLEAVQRGGDSTSIFHREEDVLLCLQLLAYLSKYPHLREQFHTAYEKNVFSVVEKFCHRLHPGPIQYWAGVIMRNACRKDETRGGIRKCANMSCGKWEQQPREFAKCRRCRKAKYCSKACQSKAWADGHRWWCVERHSSIVRGENTSGVAGTTVGAQLRLPATTTGVTHHHHHHHHMGVPITTTTTNTTTTNTIINNNQEQQESTTVENQSPLTTDNTTNTTNMLMDLGVHMDL